VKSLVNPIRVTGFRDSDVTVSRSSKVIFRLAPWRSRRDELSIKEILVDKN
jgi:hypothetical protein